MFPLLVNQILFGHTTERFVRFLNCNHVFVNENRPKCRLNRNPATSTQNGPRNKCFKKIEILDRLFFSTKKFEPLDLFFFPTKKSNFFIVFSLCSHGCNHFRFILDQDGTDNTKSKPQHGEMFAWMHFTGVCSSKTSSERNEQKCSGKITCKIMICRNEYSIRKIPCVI